MMCKSCGRDIDESLGYCTYCEGNHDDNDKEKTEKGYEDNKSDYRFKEKFEDYEKKEKNEGYEYTKCKKCGNFVSNEMSFCPHCGSYLKESGDSLFKRLKNKFVAYTSRDVEREDSLTLFMGSCLKVSFILLGLFAFYSILISFFDILFYFLQGYLLELFSKLIVLVGSFVIFSMSIRGYREVHKLVNQALSSSDKYQVLLKLFMGGFIFYGMMVISFLT